MLGTYSGVLRIPAARPTAGRSQMLAVVSIRQGPQEIGASKPRRTRKKAAKEDATPAEAAEPAADSRSGTEVHADSLQRLHGGTSDTLRALLERRAQRQRQELSSGRAAARPLPARPDVPAEAAPSRRSVHVRFWLPFHVDFGQHVCLVGGCRELGNWILADALQLQWSEGDMWNGSVEIPAGAVVEYKYVVVGPGGHAAAWQSGNNSVLALRHGDDAVEVYDNWGGNPGAQVVTAGAAPVTRENRLLAWASEVEALMSSQRQELRRARMELVAAQEDAKLAREETKRSKAALAVSEAQRIAAAGELRQATEVNRLLQAQLAETTTSFMQALDTAVGLLGGKPPAASKRGGGGGAAKTAAGSKTASTAAAAAPASEQASPLPAAAAGVEEAKDAAQPVMDGHAVPQTTPITNGRNGSSGDGSAGTKTAVAASHMRL